MHFYKSFQKTVIACILYHYRINHHFPFFLIINFINLRLKMLNHIMKTNIISNYFMLPRIALFETYINSFNGFHIFRVRIKKNTV